MQFRKLNYLTLIYHFFTFNYTLGMFDRFDNERFYRKAKMNIFFPLFTALNNLEGRPFQLKKRPFALFYYTLFCRDELRETFLPFSLLKKTGFFTVLFRYLAKNNFLFKKRAKKRVISCSFKYYNNYSILNLYLIKTKIRISVKKKFNLFSIKNIIINFENKCKIVKKIILKKEEDIKMLAKRFRNIVVYKKKNVKIRHLIKERNSKIVKYQVLKDTYIYNYLKTKHRYRFAKK